MLAFIALLISTAVAGPETVEEAIRLHLVGSSVEAAEMLLPEINDDPSAALALGRIFFAHSQWALAEASYHRVPRNSTLWFRARLEATWAAYYLDPTHERAIARALLLYLEDPTDRELRYLMGILVLHCGGEEGAGPGRVGDRISVMLSELIEELETEGSHTPPHPSSAFLEELEAMSELLLHEFNKYYDHGLYVHKPQCGWESLQIEPQWFALEQDSPVTRAVLLTLGGEKGRFTRSSGGCSLHGVDLVPQGGPSAGTPRCPDSRSHRKLDREAWRWLRSYRDELE